MLNRSDIKRMLSDLFRTELARHQKDSLAVFDDEDHDLFAKMPKELLPAVWEKAAAIFNYKVRAFSSLDLLVDYAYASFLKNQQVVFLTSGSTGTPKRCVHTVDMIWEEARGVAPLFGGVKRIVSLVPANHLYGFSFTVALPHVLQVPVINLPAIPTQPWDTLLEDGDLVVGFPLFWNYWLRCANRFTKQVDVLSSTAPCKDETIQGLLDVGVHQFTEIYGASETGAIGFRHIPHDMFEILPFWQTDFSQEPFVKIKRNCMDNWIELPDRVKVQEDRYLYPISRQDACVQVAGINVYPKHVEKVLSAHPAVKECRVRLMRPEEGERLKAFIVLTEGHTADELGFIRTYLSQQLTVHEVPKTFTFGEQLPVNDIGKDADW